MAVNIEPIDDYKCSLGEAPFWDEESQSLYYVDVIKQTINRYTPSTGAHVQAAVGDNDVSFAIPVQGENNAFLSGYGNEIVKIIWNGISNHVESLETIVELENTVERKHFWNDGKASPSGQLWSGTYTVDRYEQIISNAAALYVLQSDRTLRELASGITASNGLVWNQNINKFYYVDSFAYEIYQFDYEDATISNKEVIFKFADNDLEGFPDGMTMDADGNLWIACFTGGKVIKIDPTTPNTLLQTISMPVNQVTSVEFGGPSYEDLYVTTGGIPWGGSDAPEGGWTYRVTGLGVRGLPGRKVQL